MNNKEILVLEEIIEHFTIGSKLTIKEEHTEALTTAIQALKALKEAGEELPEIERNTNLCSIEDRKDCECLADYDGKQAYRSLAVPIVAKLKQQIGELTDGKFFQAPEYRRYLREEIARLKKQLSSYKFITQFTPEECRYLESNQKKQEEEITKLKARIKELEDDRRR